MLSLLGRDPRLLWWLPTAIAILFSWPLLSYAGEVKVAVASNFMQPMKEIATQFERDTRHSVVLAFGSSGKFYAQINHGAPFDVLLSADQAKPSALSASGLAVADSQFTYALGAIVLWSATPKDGADLLADLKAGQFNKLAFANPKLAPYGAAALEVLQHLSLQAATQPKWVQGENIAQTYQFVRTGNADLGFVARAQLAPEDLAFAWSVPKSFYGPIRQDAVLLQRGAANPAASELMRYLRSDAVKAILKKYGYDADA
ncbi:MAG TPA: molybdate ABC transporter substrate-binding protein [Marinagarivorans sp.]